MLYGEGRFLVRVFVLSVSLSSSLSHHLDRIDHTMKASFVAILLLGLFALAMASGSKLSDSTARSRITGAGISVSSSGNCKDRNNSRCTSLDQINSGTVDGIVTLKNASKCSIVITGGTETGHASGTYSHWNGYKLDISLNSCIDAYVKKSFAYQGLRSDGAPLYKSSAGNLYAKEGNHWDILYY